MAMVEGESLATEGRLALGAGQPSAGDYILLMKPRVMSLVVFTGFAGLVAAPGHISPVLALITVLAIAIGAGAAGALNMWYDADIDARMARTAARPIPRGRISREETFTLGAVLSVISVLTQGLLVNLASGALLGLTILFYMLIYTMWLKRRTPQNIVIGGAAGAFPPMIGWAAVTGGVSLDSILLFLIIFLWTPPHFWALALYRARDYERVGVPMLPVVAGGDVTRRWILIYTALLIPASLAPVATGLTGLTYLVPVAVLDIGLAAYAWQTFRHREGREADQAARRLFAYSILYLFGVFLALMLAPLARLALTGFGGGH